MIILPSGQGVKTLKNHSLEEVIFFILINQSTPLSIRQISSGVQQYWLKKYTYKGIKDAIMKLMRKGIIIEIKEKEALFRFRYTINVIALEDANKELKKVLDDYQTRYKIKPTILELFDGKPTSVFSLRELDVLLDEVELYWLENIRFDEKVILYQELYNRECLMHTSLNLVNDTPLDIIYYANYKSESFSKRFKEGKWTNKKAYIHLGTSAEKQREMRIMGDYIIVINYTPEMLEKMRFAFEESYSDTQLALQRINKIAGDIKVRIKKDKSEASYLKDKMYHEIASGDFKGLIEDLTEQKASGKEIITIHDKYAWLTKAQVDIINDFGSEQRNIFINNSDLSFLVSSIKDYIKKNLVGGDSLALIDLGVGPAIKPISLLPDLTADFKTIEYMGVDYSRRVLQAAEKHISCYQFPSLKHKFLQLDLQNLGSHPNDLLNQIISQKRVFIFVGMTYGNFNVKEIRAFVSEILRTGDILIVDNETFNTKEQIKEIMPRYPQRIHWHLQTLTVNGFSPDNFKIEYKYNEKNSAIEIIATIVSLPDFLIPQVRGIGLEVGDKIQLFQARKPSPEQFKKEIESLHEDLDVEVITQGTYSVALCKVK